MPATLGSSKRAVEAELTLCLLDDVGGGRLSSQRSAALRLGVAVGLANAYLKRCVRNGWVKVSRVGERHYFYSLTPEGCLEKSRLTTEHLTHSLAFFRTARAQCADLLDAARRHGASRILLAGDGDLAEIATLAARKAGVELVGVWTPGRDWATTASLPVFTELPEQDMFHAVLLTDIAAPQQCYERLRSWLEDERLLVPDILRVSRHSRRPCSP